MEYICHDELIETPVTVAAIRFPIYKKTKQKHRSVSKRMCLLPAEAASSLEFGVNLVHLILSFKMSQSKEKRCTVSHRSEYTPHIFVNILLYLFMLQY